MIISHLYNSSNVLSSITSKYSTTDKGPWKEGNQRGHDYTRFYDFYFKPIRDTEIYLLELGVSDGASLKVWSEYFTHPKSLICGVDHEKRYQDWDDPKVHIVIADQKDSEAILQGFSKHTYYWNIIIDDASHKFHDQIESWKKLWPHLQSGGLYIIEDIYDYRDKNGELFGIFINDLIHDAVVSRTKDIDFIHFYPEAMVIGKK
jgi:hypothetical protein